MPDPSVNIIIQELKAELKSKYPDFKGIYLFGSRARGDYNQDSDYDFLIVFDRVIDWKFKDEISDIIFDYILKYEIIIDVHVHFYQELIDPVSPFTEIVKNEGVFYDVE